MSWLQKAQDKINGSWYYKSKQEMTKSDNLNSAVNSTVNDINKLNSYLYGDTASTFYVASTPSSSTNSTFLWYFGKQ